MIERTNIFPEGLSKRVVGGRLGNQRANLFGVTANEVRQYALTYGA